MVVKVLVVDDSGFFRRRVSEILSADPSIQVVGTATNGNEALDQALALKPDVITMDYEMPMMDGIPPVRPILQIGRASCRARVCKYWEIPVCAGLLNKKELNSISDTRE